jgi:ERCC4-related helicase
MQGGIIDNHTRTLADEIVKIAPHCKSIDIAVGYFFFSGFEEIKDLIKDIPIRILVGMELDPKVISELGKHYQDGTSFKSKVGSYASATRSEKISNFIETSIAGINSLRDFDEVASGETLDILFEKLQNGTLEIRMTAQEEHSKYYVFNLKEDSDLGRIFPRLVIMGSSNLTTSGLRKQGEKNILLTEPSQVKDWADSFEHEWNDSRAVTLIDQTDAIDVVKKMKDSTWPYKLPSPYYVYLKVLKEYFGEIDDTDIYLPHKITGGLFSNLKYQIDAIKEGISKIDDYNGAIIADVVGLGKSVIGSSIAYNLYKRDDLYTIVIAPPHLCEQWQEYMDKFGFTGQVWSRGKINECFNYYKEDKRPKLIVIDEAHRFRNELTYDYTDIHQLAIGHKVLLLSATPFNNDPKDVYALIKLFQIPGAATLKTAENLGMAFRDLIREYSKLRKDKKSDSEKIKQKAELLAKELRRLIEDAVIRRSRLDLERIDEYREDLKAQGIHFPKVNEPVNIDYPLHEITNLYQNTLYTIYPESNQAIPGEHYLAARYQPTKYFTDDGREEYKKELAKEFDDEEEIAHRIEQGQSNVSKFMRHLLVRRFESSKDAFRSTLEKMIISNQLIIDWFEKVGGVPISKKIDIPEPDDLMDEIDIDENLSETDPIEELQKQLSDNNSKDFRIIKAKYLKPEYLELLKQDAMVLKYIQKQWFENPQSKDVDPKLDTFISHLKDKLQRTDGKVIVFSEFTDTIYYIADQLKKVPELKDKIITYSGQEANQTTKKIIAKNFDAGLPESEQEDDYKILLATDAISEGYNLHRADCVYNYDIPYNPTRVIQRIGRINRVNKKVYEELFIYNFFPSEIGEEETHTKSISTIKVHIFNALLGDDTKKLTTEEELNAYYSDKFNEAKSQEESESSINKYRNAWNAVKHNKELLEQAESEAVNKSKVARQSPNGTKGVVLFGKRGDTSVFCLKQDSCQETEYVGSKIALALFEATRETEGSEVSKEYHKLFEQVRDHLYKNNTHKSVPDKGRQEAISRLKILSEKLESSSQRNYCQDLIESIYDLDALADSELKLIRNIIIGDDPLSAYKELNERIPIEYIANIRRAADATRNESSMLILTEELK